MNKENEAWCVEIIFKDNTYDNNFIIDSFIKKEGFACDTYDISYKHDIIDVADDLKEDELIFSISGGNIDIGTYKIKDFIQAIINFMIENNLHYKKEKLEEYCNSL